MRSLFLAADIHRVDGADRLAEVLQLAKARCGGCPPECAFLGGDLVGLAGPNRSISEEERRRCWTPAFSVEEFREQIRASFGSDTQVCFTYGSHDKCEQDGIASFTQGPVDCGGFYLYGISFCQMKFASMEQRAEEHRGHSYDGIDSGYAASAAADFEAWLATKPVRKPIVVLSHVPLHAHRQDNLGASIWCRALNRAAENYDILFFFGHNHTAEHKTSLDRQYYLVKPGMSMPVQTDQREQSETVRLAFSYLNAGYIVNGCGTLLRLEDSDGDGRDDLLRVERCAGGAEGACFGDTGFPSPYELRLRT